jgi:hypothetical protein
MVFSSLLTFSEQCIKSQSLPLTPEIVESSNLAEMVRVPLFRAFEQGYA